MFLSADDQCRGKITTEICLHIHTQYPLSRGPFNVEQIKTPQLAGQSSNYRKNSCISRTRV